MKRCKLFEEKSLVGLTLGRQTLSPNLLCVANLTPNSSKKNFQTVNINHIFGMFIAGSFFIKQRGISAFHFINSTKKKTVIPNA
jgi:hypothetical protein